jgi:hypothetical protein
LLWIGRPPAQALGEQASSGQPFPLLAKFTKKRNLKWEYMAILGAFNRQIANRFPEGSKKYGRPLIILRFDTSFSNQIWLHIHRF